MAKISLLKITSALTGAEHLPIVQDGETKRVTMSAFRDLITPFLQYWYKGEKGDTGASNNTRTSLAALKAAPVTDVTSLYQGALYTWQTGDFSLAVNDRTFIASNVVSATQGAWVHEDILNARALKPEHFGAVGYRTREQALAGSDYSVALQAMSTAASALGLEINGNNRWYQGRTVRWVGPTWARGLRVIVSDSDQDNAPFFLDGQASPVTDVTFIDCEVDGNRPGQTRMDRSSGGDGQRAGFKLFGYTSGVRMIRCKANNCATDGFFIWTGAVTPKSVDDLLHHDIHMIDCDADRCGRHGVSFSSHKGTVIRGGRFRSNGLDIKDFDSGRYSDGGYGRRFPGDLTGRLYGRPLTHEGYHPGEHFEEWTIDGITGTGNVGGVLLFAVMFPEKRSHKGLRLLNSYVVDQFGGNGDGSLILHAVYKDGSGNTVVYPGTDAFDGVVISNCKFGRNYVRLSSAKNITIAGCEAIVSVSAYSIIFDKCEDVLSCDLKSNKPPLGRPSPITLTNIILPDGWATTGVPIMSPPVDSAGGRYKFRFGFTVVPGKADVGLVRLAFTEGFVLLPAYSAASYHETGVAVNAPATPGSNSTNQIDVLITATTAARINIALDFEAEVLPR